MCGLSHRGLMDWTTILAAVVGGLLGGGAVMVALVKGLFSVPLTKAQADKIAKESEAIAQDTHDDTHDRIDARWQELANRMEKRMDRLDDRIQYLEDEIQGRDMTIAKLTAENKHLKDKVHELEKERDQQIELNRSQGQKIARLTKALQEANKRIRQLEERLGETG